MRKSGPIFIPDSSFCCFYSKAPMMKPGLWPDARLENWMPYGSFLRRRGWNLPTILAKEPCALACSGESAVMVPKAIKATGGWRGYLRSNKPAAHDPYLCIPYWWMPSNVISKNKSLIWPGSLNFLLTYPLNVYKL